jgi:3-isopropylmalate/(R)-2-methylmalate dehydratase small subunit
VTFEGMGEHAFEDARKQNPEHPFNSPAYQGASVLVVGAELRLRVVTRARAAGAHALGHPRHRGRLLRRDLLRQLRDARHPVPGRLPGRLEWLQKADQRDPKRPVVSVDVEKQEVRFATASIKATVPDGPRHQSCRGRWDSTAVLLDAGQAIETTAAKLPYVKGVLARFYGWMFWFSRKKFVGSYLRLSARSRSYLASP